MDVMQSISCSPGSAYGGSPTDTSGKRRYDSDGCKSTTGTNAEKATNLGRQAAKHPDEALCRRWCSAVAAPPAQAEGGEINALPSYAKVKTRPPRGVNLTVDCGDVPEVAIARALGNVPSYSDDRGGPTSRRYSSHSGSI
jgi:hypothetical protein